MMTGALPIFSEAWIGSEWVSPNRRYPVVNPATGGVVAEVADCGASEAHRALEIAVQAFQQWKVTSVYERSKVLSKFHELILKYRDELARTMTMEMGKPIKESLGEVEFAASFVLWFAEEAKRLYGDTIPSSSAHKRLLVQVAPVGPVFAITPWNFPAGMLARKMAPALAVGCSFVAKPAEQAPLTTLQLAFLAHHSGLPAGLFQVLPTTEPAAVTGVFLDDSRVRKISFTGSTEVGKELLGRAAKTVKRVSLELGGHAPFIVFRDADLKATVGEAVRCKFRNAGQTCVSANRFYIHKDVRDEFVDLFCHEVSKLKMGSPLDEATDIGPLVDRRALNKVRNQLEDAVSRGAKVILGGRVSADDLFFEPTVVTDVNHEMLISTEETFGPLAPIYTFANEDEVTRFANGTPYGLAAYFFTKDISRVYRLAEALDFGVIGVNDGIPSTAQAPFGGLKFSGVGKEGSRYGIDDYVERKFISINLNPT